MAIGLNMDFKLSGSSDLPAYPKKKNYTIANILVITEMPNVLLDEQDLQAIDFLLFEYYELMLLKILN